MKFGLRKNKDLWAGMMLIGIGVAAMLIAGITGSAVRYAWGPASFRSSWAGYSLYSVFASGDRDAARREDQGHVSSGRWSCCPCRYLVRPPDGTGRFRSGYGGVGLRLGGLGQGVQVCRGSRADGFPDAGLNGRVHLGAGLPYPLIRGSDKEIAMELFHNLIFGFGVAFSLQNLLYCFIGVMVGTLIGVLPGIGPMATIAMLLRSPTTSAGRGDDHAAGIYYGAMYGGSTTSILVNLPGETASVITCIDGYQMARQGRAGAALSISAIGSFFAGTFVR